MRVALLIMLLGMLAGCARGPRAPGSTGFPAPESPKPVAGKRYQVGKATWYGGKHHGGPTASEVSVLLAAGLTTWLQLRDVRSLRKTLHEALRLLDRDEPIST